MDKHYNDYLHADGLYLLATNGNYHLWCSMDRVGRYYAPFIPLFDAYTDMRFYLFSIRCIRETKDGYVDGDRLYDSACSSFVTGSTFLHILQLCQSFCVDKIYISGDTTCMVFNACIQLPKSGKMINRK